MAEVTGTIGSESVELNNAATEQTLRALLNTVQRQNQYILQNQKALNQIAFNSAKGATGAGTAGAKEAKEAAKGLENVAEGAVETAAKLNPLAKGAMILGGVVGDLAASAFKTVGNLTSFAGTLIDGQGSLSGFYASLKDLPLGLGLVAGLFEKIAKMQEEELEQYRKLTDAGINFGGQLNQIRQSALSLGLSMDQFSTILAKNNDVLNLMGGSVNDGAKSFVRLAKELRDSPVGKELRALGFTSEQATEGLANYIRVTGGRNAEELKNSKALTESAGQYMKQLDMMAQLTGKSREAMEKELQEQSKNAAWQSYLNTLDEKGRAKAMASLQAALAKGGKGAADALQSRLLGLPPLTEEAQIFESMAGKAADALGDYVDVVKDGNKGIGDVNKATAKFVVGLAEEGKKIGPNFGAALIQAGGAVGQFASLSLAAQTELRDKGIKTQEDYENYMNRVIADGKKREESAAAQAAESEKALKDMANSIYGALQPAIAALTPIVNDLANQFMDFVKDNLPEIKEALTKLAQFIKEFAENLFSQEGRDKIVNDMAYYIKLMMIEVKKAVLPSFMYDEEDAKRDRAKLEIEKESYDRKAEAARLERENSNKIAALQAVNTDGGIDKIKNEIKDTEDKKKALEDLKNKGVTLTTEQEKQLISYEKLLAKDKQILKYSEDRSALEEAKTAQKTINEKKAEGEKAGKRSEEIKKGDETVHGWEGAAAGAATLGGAGALIGSVIPVVGTAIGGAIGAALGGLAGGLGLIDYGIKGSQVTDEEKKKYNPVEKRALGGPVDANTPYWVGEKGPELFKPKVAGDVVDANTSKDTSKNMPSFSFANAFKSMLPALNPLSGMQGILKEYNEKTGGKSQDPIMNALTNIIGTGEEEKPKDEDKTITADQAKTLIAELQTLNKLTGDMLRQTREVAENTKKNVDATKALSGNLLT